MSSLPDPLKVYHITHGKNLAGIIAEGCLWSDGQRTTRALPCELVGMSKIKQRRLTELPVPCHKGTRVGEYVPFNFCPRSIMLYILNQGNHPGITYRGGQRPILHLQADVRQVVKWARRKGIRWAFSTRNAGAQYCQFRNSLDKLDQIDWSAVAASDFRDSAVKDGKQAEFLVHERFPWELVEKIGVMDSAVFKRVQTIIADAKHRPAVCVERGWYF